MEAKHRATGTQNCWTALVALVVPDKERGVIQLVKYIGLAAMAAKAVETWLALASGMQFLVMIESILRLDGEADYLSFIASEPMMVVAMLICFGSLAAAMAWFYWYPGTARFFLMLPAAGFIVSSWLKQQFGPSLIRLEDTPYISLVVLLACLLVVDPRAYWRGATRSQVLAVGALHLLVFGNAVWLLHSMLASLKTYLQVYIIILIWLAVGPLLSRAKLGWLLALVLAAIELVLLGAAYWRLTDIPLEPVIPALTIILLLLPPVFRWYFPRKDAPAESEEPG